MGITLSALGELFTPLQGFMDWFIPRTRGTEPLAPRSRSKIEPFVAPRSYAGRPAAVVRSCERTRRPLRVIRVIESSGAAPHAQGQRPGAGRMFISGRMADVCAELDRLAALEAAAG